MKRRRREEEDEEDGLKTMEERYNGLGDYIKMSCFLLVGACFKRGNRLPDHSRLLSDQTLLIYDADQTDRLQKRRARDKAKRELESDNERCAAT